MRRRLLLATGALAVASPVVARAQAGKVFRVGVLVVGQREPFWSIFLNTLKGLGYVEGTNIKFEYRSAEFVPERLDALAAELVAAAGVRPAGERLRALYSPGVQTSFGRPSVVR